MTDAFVIAGGGSGAKVVEALVHLCAAGMGPERLHILLVDGDAQNGNLTRAHDTAQFYRELERFPWSIKVGERERTFFRSEVMCYQLTDPVGGEDAAHRGMRALYEGNAAGIAPAMNLLFDTQETDCGYERGFYARPNVGCLLLADHIHRFMMAPAAHPGPDDPPASSAGAFLAAMTHAASVAAGSQRICPVVVVGSLFGGTGASLLPIAEGCVKKAFAALKPQACPHFDCQRWARVMTLPYFRPAEMAGMVDPDRFLLDASNALLFYGGARFSGPTYIIGSNDPARNRVIPCQGGNLQANPGFVEELLAAAAVLDFIGKAHLPSPPPQVRVLQDLHTAIWDMSSLPIDLEKQEDLAHLLHLAAFFLRHANTAAGGEHDQGLYEYLVGFQRENGGRALARVPWFSRITAKWASGLHFAGLDSGSSPSKCAEVLVSPDCLEEPCCGAAKEAALSYFARLVLWANGTLDRPGTDGHPHSVSAVTLDPAATYASLHNTMCLVRPDQVAPNGAGAADNLLVQVCRIAMAAMELEKTGQQPKLPLGVTRFELWQESPRRCCLATRKEQVTALLEDHLPNSPSGSLAQGYAPADEGF